jgi:hypothetical protein
MPIGLSKSRIKPMAFNFLISGYSRCLSNEYTSWQITLSEGRRLQTSLSDDAILLAIGEPVTIRISRAGAQDSTVLTTDDWEHVWQAR